QPLVAKDAAEHQGQRGQHQGHPFCHYSASKACGGTIAPRMVAGSYPSPSDPGNSPGGIYKTVALLRGKGRTPGDKIHYSETARGQPAADNARRPAMFDARAIPLIAAILAAPFAAGGEPLRYQYDGADYQGYYASPGPGAPLVLVLHDWDGLTDYEKRRADMLAELGYAALAADMFGADVRPTTSDEKMRHTGALMADRARMRGLMLAALDAAQKAGADRSRAVAAGYCLGGGAALELGRSGADLAGFVSFHGTLAAQEGQDYADTRGEILVLHGSADEPVPMADFAALAETLEKAGVPHEMISYGGAPHAFTVFGIDNYREDAD